MYGSELTCISFWWIVPLFMMVICIFMMRKRRGSMMCGFGFRGTGSSPSAHSETAGEILDKRYASGEIDRDQYQEIKKTIANPSGEMPG